MKLRKYWTTAEIRQLRKLYPIMLTAQIAKTLRKKLAAVYKKAFRLGLKKSAAFLASDASSRLTTRFKKGHISWNKDTHFTAGGRSALTRFKKGNKPHTWKPIGYERVTKEGVLQRKITPRDFRAVHALIWEEAHGPIPRDHIVVFKDRNRRNFALSNLECISRSENMRRNSYHRYPKAIGLAIQLRGALIRSINRRLGKHEKQNRGLARPSV